MFMRREHSFLPRNKQRLSRQPLVVFVPKRIHLTTFQHHKPGSGIDPVLDDASFRLNGCKVCSSEAQRLGGSEDRRPDMPGARAAARIQGSISNLGVSTPAASRLVNIPQVCILRTDRGSTSDLLIQSDLSASKLQTRLSFHLHHVAEKSLKL